MLCRPVPVLAEASVVFAGLVRANYGRFVRLTAASNLGIAAGYAAVGAFSRRLDSYSFLIAFLGALLLPGIFILVSRTTYGRDRDPRRLTAADEPRAERARVTAAGHAATSD